ncbi:MAG: RIP metalloprotease RseP [bacterium]|nr:RIP metalloprotease RseP [bacterium]
MSIVKILIALLVFSVIVIIHELGHFLLAKKNGITVTEFSLGMGPRLLSHQGKETRYSVKLLPLGGSCMMLGEDETSDDPGAFNKKGVWARISVIAAGPIFNFILAFVLALFVVGFSGIDEAVVEELAKGYPAAEAGMQPGDVITKINGSHVDISRDIDVYFQFHPLVEGSEVSVTYERNGEEFTSVMLPKKYDRYMLGITRSTDESSAKITGVTEDGVAKQAGLQANDVVKSIDGIAINSGIEFTTYMNEHPFTGEEVTIVYERDGKEGVAKVTPKLASSAYSLGLSYNQYRGGKITSPLQIIKYSYVEVKFWIKTVVASLGQLVTGKLSKDDIAGPVGMFEMIGDSYEQAASIGFSTVLLSLSGLIILLSANLGVMNLLPLPALDGGRLVFLFIEAVRGKPVDPEKEGFVHMIGFIALMLLMVFVFYNDIMRIVG